ncbi:unnamed protein product, partial [Musa acuminata var. zebrina]
SNNTKEGRIAPQKTVSFKEVAAAAYAITSMEEKSMNQNKTIEQLMHPTAKTKSKREDSIDKTPDYIKLIRWFT